MDQDRRSGILLHVTSLPSYGGVGDMGPAAYGFVDFLVSAKQRMWQVLPLNPTGYGNSPYAALSAFAGNPLLISLEFLVRDGWLYQGEIEGLAGHYGQADFDRAWNEKLPLIQRAAQRMLDGGQHPVREHFEQFCKNNAYWLNDYVRYVVLRREHDYACWCDWPDPLAAREPGAMNAFDAEHADALWCERAVQFLFQQQWSALKSYCNQHDIQVMGDMAIFVNYDSADVWANREIFDLKKDFKPRVVSGVPPDYFSATGQRWGNPLYLWKQIEKTGFDWWVKRVQRQMELYDVLRLDHFRGFEAYWEIDAAEETAVNGKWVKAPGAKLFKKLQAVMGKPLPLVAEDLGLITAKVDKLREDFAMPGMRVMQFGFSDRGAHLHLPHKWVQNMVAYTGTHDNNTTLGWYRDDVDDETRRNVQAYVGPLHHQNDVVWALIRAAERSVANTCIIPLQDLLHLGSDGRMNTPAGTDGNWAWRFHPEALHPDIAAQMAAITEMTDRDGYVAPDEASGATV
ncbi:MAG: 4-alpha-glucanotransferase [Acidobacteria bacterium]|nr:4-alpha-glucanotransferase [Acidobacteriota bacterium]